VELILVRHGEPLWVVDGKNRNDPELTERGRAQAALVAARLADPEVEPADGPVDVLLVSPARRAQETCAPIAAALGLDPATQPWLVEMGMPDAWDDQPIEVVEAAFAEQRSRPRMEWWDGLPGAETMQGFHDRVSGGLDATLAALGVRPAGEHALWDVEVHAPSRVVAVAHGGTNSTVVAHLLGVEKEPWDWYRFVMGHASVAVLRTQPLAGAHIWSLCALGDATHLDRADRTA
jgi:broad specificity phosphatase PhoE